MLGCLKLVLFGVLKEFWVSNEFTLKWANTFEAKINGRTIEVLDFVRLLFFHLEFELKIK